MDGINGPPAQRSWVCERTRANWSLLATQPDRSGPCEHEAAFTRA